MDNHQTPEQAAYYTLNKAKKTSFLIDFAYKFRKSMQTGQQRFTPSGHHRFKPDEIQYFWIYVTSRSWISALDTPEEYKKQLTLFDFARLQEMRTTPAIQAQPPRLTANRPKNGESVKIGLKREKTGAIGAGLSFTPPPIHKNL